MKSVLSDLNQNSGLCSLTDRFAITQYFETSRNFHRTSQILFATCPGQVDEKKKSPLTTNCVIDDEPVQKCRTWVLDRNFKTCVRDSLLGIIWRPRMKNMHTGIRI